MVELDTEAQERAYNALAGFCTTDKGFQPAVNDAPGFAIRSDHCLVFALAFPWGEDSAVIQVRATMARNVPESYDAMRWLLKLNDEVVLGAFGWSADSGLFFGHTILADDIDESEMASSIVAVARTGDQYGPEILDRFGGKPLFEE